MGINYAGKRESGMLEKGRFAILKRVTFEQGPGESEGWCRCPGKSGSQRKQHGQKP